MLPLKKSEQGLWDTEKKTTTKLKWSNSSNHKDIFPHSKTEFESSRTHTKINCLPICSSRLKLTQFKF
jgi:hypothetical protein